MVKAFYTWTRINHFDARMPNLVIANLHILLIEPSPTQQKIIVHHLQEAGVGSVHAVGSGKEVEAYLQHDRPDLLISSMYLPDCTATDLLLTLRQSEDWAAIPFMLVSSETRFRALDPIKQAGVVAILPKPFAADDIVRALKASLHYLEHEELELEHFDPHELRVLVVDDSLTARNHIRRMLNTLGIERVTLASSGKEACKQLNEQTFDLVVTDYNMPEMDGEELVRAIRSRSDGAYIPIMMVTSEQDQTLLQGVQQAGVSALLDKPFSPDVVKQTLLNMLNH
ncbi:response regulator receiver protein [Permianibacter aggregans]|uniref:Response regulator receiver protein n=2 Tax=Permianibacter aggregans TaxID=1510150 RepID=A0A4V3D854_9GAMM|nr:response regulator receiver protein [Permianibacter aggregans]